ncbi:hypothetical protein [Streptomyces lonarensis]|uniref:DUF8083 domain-containing protein n=1 Tax=Streptomyces lonarensis TaxID=700599 RepID=A0A7X6D1P1_9ACTN|nr:hypothetical protein [Streptomyces lonarensis]NJQ06579.1 hypothetical protein [Streptomyces lonarensis]
MPQVPYASYLRIYEPLTAFPEPERSHWERYAQRDDLPGAQDELARSLISLITDPGRPAPEEESGDAFVARLDGALYVCPWRTRLRAWQALEEAGHWMMPESVLDRALPVAGRRRAERQHRRWVGRHPTARPWIRSALWHVPIRWFSLFDDSEREFFGGAGGPSAPGQPPVAGGEPPSGEVDPGARGQDGARPEDTAPTARARPASLRYRTSMVRARHRLAGALRTVRRATPHGLLVPALTDVGRWLEEFHPRSLVELDYGGLVHTISADRLEADHSAADVGEAVAALAAEDVGRAGELYEVLTERWTAVRERQFAS